ncbi:MAG: 4a-hydroxytetrahydrobiopterin dehydratase [Thermodesulfobacteriota bacterium]
MEELADRKCEACRRDAPLATEEQIRVLSLQLPEWEVVEISDTQRLMRAFSFNNFVEAIEFTNRVGAIAEEEGHHPAILTEYGSVTVSWWSHKIKGLHVNDFIMAARTERVI